MAQWINLFKHQIRIVDANYIVYEKNWTCTGSGPGSYGRQARGRQVADEIQLKITVHRKIRLFALFNQGTASLQQ